MPPTKTKPNSMVRKTKRMIRTNGKDTIHMICMRFDCWANVSIPTSIQIQLTLFPYVRLPPLLIHLRLAWVTLTMADGDTTTLFDDVSADNADEAARCQGVEENRNLYDANGADKEKDMNQLWSRLGYWVTSLLLFILVATVHSHLLCLDERRRRVSTYF